MTKSTDKIELQTVRQCFPLLSEKVNGKPLIYFDNAATTQKPQAVLDAGGEFYQKQNANVHRAAHYLSAKATQSFEASRQAVQCFINAPSSHEIIWTSGTTASINLVANSWGLSNLNVGDEVIVSRAEHHANIVPWQQVCQQTGASLKVVELNARGEIDISHLAQLLSPNTKMIAIHHISNVIGKLNPVHEIIAMAKSVEALVLIDAAQSISHVPIDVQALGCDFLVFSAHKLYGPTGVGVLYGKAQHLNAMPPYQTGGEMIKKVSFTGTEFNELPFKFEAGTPNIAGVTAFRHALDFVKRWHVNSTSSVKSELREYCYHALKNVSGLTFVVDHVPDIALFSFTIDGHHPQDIASFLDAHGVAVRAGHHCAMPLMESLNLDGCVRLSLAPYNTLEEVDVVIELLVKLVSSEDEISAKKPIDIYSTNTEQNDALTHIVEQFAKAKSWDAKHRVIMLLGKPKLLNETIRQPQFLVEGCESSAWLKVEVDQNSLVSLTFASDAKLIRGLFAIIDAAFNGMSKQQAVEFDISPLFFELGLLQHLSPSRGNGLLAIVQRIKQQLASD